MRNIVLNSFSGGLKTSFITKYHFEILHKGYQNIFDSDSKIMKKGYELFTAEDFNQIPRTLFRYYLMENFKENSFFNRSIIDNLIFSELSRQGKLEVRIGEQSEQFNYKHLKSLVKYENEYDCRRFLIINNDEYIVRDILNTPNFKDTSRFDIYENIEQYFDYQKQYVEMYMDLIENYEIIFLESEYNYDQKLKFMFDDIFGD